MAASCQHFDLSCIIDTIPLANQGLPPKVIARRVLTLALVALCAASACRQKTLVPQKETPKAALAPYELRIGYQRSSWAFLALRHEGTLEARLAPLGAKVNWLEFTAGTAIMEGLNVGSIDIALVGDAPPIFAQAGGFHFVYAAVEPAKPRAAALIVLPGSVLNRVQDLKGKKVGVAKGSSAHHLLIESLTAAGLSWQDIAPVYLAPPDGRAAFEAGRIDAWAIWDPLFAAAELQLKARVLDNPQTGFSYRQFFVARAELVSSHRPTYDALIAAVRETDQRINEHPAEVAAALAADARLDVTILTRALGRGAFGVQPLNEAVWSEQQRLADMFAELKLVPKLADVRAAALAEADRP